MDKEFLTQLEQLKESGARSLRSLSVPKSVRILVLGPHPDDFDTIAATLRCLMQNGNTIDVAVVRSTTGVLDSYRPNLTPIAKAIIREEEQRRSCAYFGLPENHLMFFDLDEDFEGAVCSTGNMIRLQKVILLRESHVVCLPHGRDSNGGHQNVYRMMSQLVSASDHSLTLWLSVGPRTPEVPIHLFTEFGEYEAKWKGELLLMHDSQQYRNLKMRGYAFSERILGCNRRMGKCPSLAGPYAEAFEIETYRAKVGD
jgi:LmbE family N-acetylglucosaminyl deacetylase